jgi:hypothetical protein
MKDDYLWQIMLSEHADFVKFVVTAQLEPALTSEAPGSFHFGIQPPPPPAALLKQRSSTSGATALQQGSNEAAIVAVPAPQPGASPLAAFRGGWSARRAFRHIHAARRARVVSWVAPHDTLLAYPAMRVPRLDLMQDLRIMTRQDFQDRPLGDVPAAREGTAMASLLGRYSVTFGGWSDHYPVQRNDLHVRCLMDAWPCEPAEYSAAVAAGAAIRQARSSLAAGRAPWDVLVASPPRAYDGWVRGASPASWRRHMAQDQSG